MSERDLIAKMSRELDQAHARIDELETERRMVGEIVCVTMPIMRDHGVVGVAALANRIGELMAELEQQAGQSLGYVVVLKDPDGDLTCLASVFDSDGVRTAEGIGSGYASHGEEYLIAELREVSDR